MKEKSLNERIAGVEVKTDLVYELLKEARDDVKEQPSRKEFTDIHNRVEVLEDYTNNLLVKVGVVSCILGSIGGIVLTLVLKYILKVL